MLNYTSSYAKRNVPQAPRRDDLRVRQIMKLPLEYVPNEHFQAWIRDKKAEDEVLGPMPQCGESPQIGQRRSFAFPYSSSLYGLTVLSRQQEVYLFRKMNHLKYKASALRKSLDPFQPQEALMTQIENLYSEIVATRNEIISANLRLVVSIAKRYVGPALEIYELISDGNVTLIRAVEQFDYSMGNRFCAYATRAIMNQFARMSHLAIRQRDRFRTNQMVVFSAASDVRGSRRESEMVLAGRETTLDGILRRLEDRERRIIVCRFGLHHGRRPQTLKQVSDALGVSAERVRQIQARALEKLRQASVQNGNEKPIVRSQPGTTAPGGDRTIRKARVQPCF